MKPDLTIDLIAPEGNAYQLVAKAQRALIEALQSEQANELEAQFIELTLYTNSAYQDIRALVEKYCNVTWMGEHARLKEALIDVQENAAELADALELLRTDIDNRQPIKTAEARRATRELREALDVLTRELDARQEDTL